MPPCPSDIAGWFQRFNTSRAEYWHDGTHYFEPKELTWDNKLGKLAQRYANQIAETGQPLGQAAAQLGYEAYWVGEFDVHHEIAGLEDAESCTCPPPESITLDTAPVWYHQGNSLFRGFILRQDGVYKMGVGHVSLPDGGHVWTLFTE